MRTTRLKNVCGSYPQLEPEPVRSVQRVQSRDVVLAKERRAKKEGVRYPLMTAIPRCPSGTSSGSPPWRSAREERCVQREVPEKGRPEDKDKGGEGYPLAAVFTQAAIGHTAIGPVS